MSNGWKEGTVHVRENGTASDVFVLPAIPPLDFKILIFLAYKNVSSYCLNNILKHVKKIVSPIAQINARVHCAVCKIALGKLSFPHPRSLV